MSAAPIVPSREKATAPLRIGFSGAGWIGRHRMKAMIETGHCKVVAVAEPDAASARAAREIAGSDVEISDHRRLLESDLDGIVIATPNFLHAEQSIAALERGISVFCQKPLARNCAETQRVIDAARSAD